MRSSRLILLFSGMAILTAAPVLAQDQPLASILNDVFADILLQPPPAGSPFASHSAHFLPSESGERAPVVFGQALTTQLSSVPIAMSGSAFTYRYDESLGTFTRSTDTFGPSLAERAVTLGKGRFGFGFTFQRSEYQKFEGKALDTGDIQFFLAHQECCNNAFFEGDLIQERVSLNLTTKTVTLFGNYGMTDRVDVGIVVPISSVDLSTSVDERVLRLATGESGNTSTIHLFPGDAPRRLVEASGTATGIGDILLRGKFRILEGVGGGLAAGVDVRLPTGDEDELLGLGTMQVRFLGIVSRSAGRFAPHANLGFTASGDSPVATNEVSYAIGTEFAPAKTLTFCVDFLGRSLLDVDRFEEQQVQHTFRNAANVPGTFTYTQFAPVTGNLYIGSGAFGVKYNPTRALVVSFDLVVPFTESGLTPGVTPIVGVDYSF